MKVRNGLGGGGVEMGDTGVCFEEPAGFGARLHQWSNVDRPEAALSK